MKKNKIVNKIGILVLAVMLSILSSITVLASEPEVGKFQIGRYHAIIRKSYADGSVDYETSFSDHADLSSQIKNK